MSPIACRVPPALHELIDAASAEAGLFRSDIIRRALMYYIATNPDHLEAFADREVPGGIRTIPGNGGEVMAERANHSGKPRKPADGEETMAETNDQPTARKPTDMVDLMADLLDDR